MVITTIGHLIYYFPTHLFAESVSNDMPAFNDMPDMPSTSTGPPEDTPRKRKLKTAKQRLKTQVCRLKKKLEMEPRASYTTDPADIKVPKAKRLQAKKTEKLCNDLAEVLSGPALDFVVCQVKQAKKKNKGLRWNTKDKSLALTMFHSSPKTYKLLQRVFKLPSVKTLQRVLRNINVQPGFNNNILEALGHKVSSMSEAERLCVVIMDEMAMKECLCYNASKDAIEGFEDFGNLGRTKFIANHAIAFMVKGIFRRWKQPVGYFLSSGPMSGQTMKTLLFELIEKLAQIGLKVKVVIGDQGSNNRNLFETILKANVKKPYFVASESKIYVLYDPPHLIKNVRNNLKKHGLEVDGHSVLWEYIKTFWEFDSGLPIRLAPKLSSRHIELPPFAPLRVKLATQVLSHSVAAGISTLCALKKLPPEAQYTAEFCERMDQLFNSFNSQTVTSNSKMRHALREKSGHIEFLKECQKWLDGVKSMGKRKLPCLSGWQMAISCLLELWEELHTQYGMHYLLTNRLNQDCVENLFSVIRGKGGHRDNPDASQFRSAFRQVMVDAIMVPSARANCQEDADTFLLNLKSIGTPDPSNNPAPTGGAPDNALPVSVQSILSVMAMPSEDLSLEECNILAYICGYICRKIQGKVCEECFGNLKSTINPDNPAHVFLSKKNYGDTRGGGLIAPSQDLYDMVETLEKEYRDMVESVTHMDRIMYRLVTGLEKKVAGFFPCTVCGSRTLMVSLFVRVRFHHDLKEQNKRSATAKGRKNRKVLKFSHQ